MVFSQCFCIIWKPDSCTGLALGNTHSLCVFDEAGSERDVPRDLKAAEIYTT